MTRMVPTWVARSTTPFATSMNLPTAGTSVLGSNIDSSPVASTDAPPSTISSTTSEVDFTANACWCTSHTVDDNLMTTSSTTVSTSSDSVVQTSPGIDGASPSGSGHASESGHVSHTSSSGSARDTAAAPRAMHGYWAERSSSGGVHAARREWMPRSM